ncbi:MAG: PAS domain S-box protein [Leptolyngbya sp.]|nr:PAS domain S-box protein [Candidatus Melainabacteria bacterium]
MAEQRPSREIDEVAKQLDRLLTDAAVNPQNDKDLMLAMSATTEELNVAIEELKVQAIALAEARDSAEAERRRYYDLFDLAPDGYIVTDMNTRITEANTAAGELLNVQPRMLVGKPLTVFFERQTRDDLFSTIRLFEAKTIKRLDDKQMIVIPRNGTAFTASLTLAINYGDKHHRPGLRWMIRDISQRREMEYQIEVHAKQLEQSNSELKQFAFVAAHDLKEPLRIISNYSQLLLKDKSSKLSDAGASYLQVVCESAAKMLSLIKDILSYSTILDSPVELEEVLLKVALTDALEECRLLIVDTNAVIKTKPLPQILVPHSRFVQLFKNLIGNALKFRSERKPVIEIGCTKVGAFFEISIKDNGIGIEAEYEDKIFTMFQRLHSESEFPGNGIGLALCRKIVTGWDGKIWFTSTYKKGSTFTFTYPIKS